MENLYNAMRKAVSQFGTDIMAEVRLIHILSDFGAFGSLPATKNILKDMLLNGDCQTIVNLGRRKSLLAFLNNNKPIGKPEGDEWKVKLTSLATYISQQRGFEKRLVVYVIDCIVYGIGWSDIEPTLHWSDDREKRVRIDTDIEVKSDLQQDNLSLGQNKQQSSSVSYQDIEDTQFVVMQVEPKNAEVFIDGIQHSVYRGIMAVELPIGNHTYEVKADSYESQKGNFLNTRDEKLNLQIHLELADLKVLLLIIAAETDTEICIDGVHYGRGRWAGIVDAGSFEIECYKPKFYSFKKTITLGENKKEIIHIPALKLICGDLKIDVQPYGSSIFINGENKGTTPLLIKNIPIGLRTVRIISIEGTEYSTVVDIKEGKVTNINHIIPSLCFNDYSQVKIGDYFYKDGTISHEMVKGKEIVGIVFSLETSDEEKKHGWRHGQIVALNDASPSVTAMKAWGIPTNSILRYAIQNPKEVSIKEDNGYKISHLDCITNSQEYAPFYIASKYKVSLPNGKTSGWYLPCLYQWDKIRDIKFLKEIICYKGNKEYATSSIMDSKYAWVYTMRLAEDSTDSAYSVKEIDSSWRWLNIRSVAAF